MPDIRYIDKDFVKFTYGADKHAILAFGDKVDVLQEGSGSTPSRIKALELFEGTLEGTVKGKPFRSREKGVLRMSMVDVQQGDGIVLETPPDANHDRKLVFIDGGDNQLFARHVAARYLHRESSPTSPLEVDLILITHGDADHFEGLIELRKSETDAEIEERKRLFIRPHRVYHNGLVKGPSKIGGVTVDPLKMFGRTVTVNGTPMIVDLFEDSRTAPADKQNVKFKSWNAALNHWQQRGPITFKRVAHGMDVDALFGFLGPKLKFEIQGPFTSQVNDGGVMRDALPFLHEPPKSAVLHLQEDSAPAPNKFSDSHTINGHSIAFRLTYGNVRFNFTGDLNQESMAIMRNRIGLANLEAEIVKAPHHGAADFDFEALKAMRPVVSLISSGDESADKEYIHPRATLVAALGKASRGDTGIVLCTELAAFFKKRDYSHERPRIAKFYDGDEALTITRADLKTFYGVKLRPEEDRKALPSFFGFERTNFGIIHIRTDGERVLVFTHSGKAGMKEAYRFVVGTDHSVTFAKDVTTG